jgi:hypothetical protein
MPESIFSLSQGLRIWPHHCIVGRNVSLFVVRCHVVVGMCHILCENYLSDSLSSVNT